MVRRMKLPQIDALARLPRLQRHAVIARPDPLLSADDLNRQLLERARELMSRKK